MTWNFLFIICLNSFLYFLNLKLSENLLIIFLGPFNFLNSSYTWNFIFFLLFITLRLYWIFEKYKIVYLFLEILLSIQGTILLLLLYSSTVETDNLLIIDNFIKIIKSFTFEDLYYYLLKIKPNITLVEAQYVLQNINTYTPQGILDYLNEANTKPRETNFNKNFFDYYTRCFITVFIFFRIILFFLIFNAKTSLEMKYYRITTNPLLNIYYGIRVPLFCWSCVFEQTFLFRKLFLNDMTRPLTSKTRNFIKNYIKLEHTVKERTHDKIKIFLFDKIFLFVSFLGVWSILWIKYWNSTESIFLAPALFSILYFTISYMNLLYVYTFKITYRDVQNKVSRMAYIMFPLWVLFNRFLFLYLLLSSWY